MEQVIDIDIVNVCTTCGISPFPLILESRHALVLVCMRGLRELMLLAKLGFGSALVTIFQKWKIGDGVDFMGKALKGDYIEKMRQETNSNL